MRHLGESVPKGRTEDNAAASENLLSQR